MIVLKKLSYCHWTVLWPIQTIQEGHLTLVEVGYSYLSKQEARWWSYPFVECSTTLLSYPLERTIYSWALSLSFSSPLADHSYLVQGLSEIHLDKASPNLLSERQKTTELWLSAQTQSYFGFYLLIHSIVLLNSAASLARSAPCYS